MNDFNKKWNVWYEFQYLTVECVNIAKYYSQQTLYYNKY